MIGAGRLGDRARVWLGGAVIAVASLIAFAPALDGDFVWDDDTHLLDNPVLEENGLYKVWLTPPERINYWPVTFTTYWVEHQLWGLDPVGYHVVNLLIHVLGCILIWRVLAVLGVPFAWLAALVFAVHPVNVESVAWIAQRKNLLSLLFFFLTLWLYLRFEDRRGVATYVLALLSFLAAMFSKGAAAPLPAVLLLCAWWRRGGITRRDVGLSLPFFGITLLASLLEFSTQVLVAGSGTIVVRDESFLTRLAGSGWVWWFYLTKALLPVHLSFVYPRWEIDARALLAWLPLLGVAGVYGAAWRGRRGWGRPVLLALVFFGLMLSPVLGFFDIYFMRFSYVADHYQYLALVGVVALVVGAAGARWGGTGPVPRRPFAAAALIGVAVLTASSAMLSSSYRSAEVLWRDTLERNPDAFLAHYNLAHLLQLEGRLDEAAHHYRERLRVGPDFAPALSNLGMIHQDQGRKLEAIGYFRRAVAADPNHLEAHNNLAVLLQEQGDTDEAITHYEAALLIEPDSATVHYNLGLLLERAGRLDEALASYRRALEIDPDAEHVREGVRRLRRPSDPERAPGPSATRTPARRPR